MQSYLLTTLDGGTRVVTEPLPAVRSVAIGLWIGTGSRDEDDAHAGVSHFLEHLLFKGTASYSALEIAEIFDTFGGELNAATARDYTVVYARVLDEHLETALDVMTDMVFTPSLADLDAEREVVLEEIAMVDDTPQELIFDLVTQAVFGRHPLGRPVLGSADVISNVSRRSLGAFHRRRYRPDNVVVATAGSVDHDRLVKLIEAMSAKAGASATGKPRARAPFVAPPKPVARLPVEADGAVPRLPLGARDRALRPAALHRLDPRRHPRRLRLVAALPGDPREARPGVRRLHVLVPVRGHGADRRLRRDARGEPRRVHPHRRGADRRAGRARPAADELARAKENLKTRIMLSMEATSNRMSRLGKSLITDSELLDFDRILAEIEAVEADSVSKLAEVVLHADAFSVAAIGPTREKLIEAVEPVCPQLVERAAA